MAYRTNLSHITSSGSHPNVTESSEYGEVGLWLFTALNLWKIRGLKAKLRQVIVPLIVARLTSCSNLTYFVVMNPSESDPRHLSIFNYPILIILKCLGSLSDGFMTTKYVKFEQDVNLASIRGTIT